MISVTRPLEPKYIFLTVCLSQDEPLNLSEPQCPNQQNENIESGDV